MYLITGVAGFIGMHFAVKMLNNGEKVIGVDNINNYYDTNLKKKRIQILKKYRNFNFIKGDLKDTKTYDLIKKKSQNINYIVHLAGQAGVRYSIKNPSAYVNDNILAYIKLLEAFKNSKKLKCIVYASSSSVYGKSHNHNSRNFILKPISVYAATKISMELISSVYLDLYKIKSIGIRFFTVYGSYGRPDMAYYKFCNQIKKNEIINVFNKGKHKRSFTYIDDAINNLYLILKNSNKINTQKTPVLNIGNPKTVNLTKFISILEKKLFKKSKKKYLKRQPGDVLETKAIINFEKKKLKFQFKTELEEGINKFVNWHNKYHK